MFRALLRTPTGAAGEKAAAEPTRREATASFMIKRSVYYRSVDYCGFFWRCLVPSSSALPLLNTNSLVVLSGGGGDVLK